MIRSVSFEGTTFAEPPFRFEAGTPNVSGIVGMGAAAAFLEAAGLPAVAEHEAGLVRRAIELLEGMEGVTLVGTAPERASVVSFVLEGIHPHDAGTLLDQEGIAVRTGHHCAQPAMERFGVPATVRASLALYNRESDVDALVSGLQRVREVFS